MDSESFVSIEGFPKNEIYFFGEFSFETDKNILLKSEKIVSLPPKTCELLGVLIKNAGRILSKEELMDTVWQDVFVEESNLSHHIAALRKGLGEAKNSKQFIETVPRKGYRFVAPVTTKNNLELVITETLEKRVTEEIAENSLIGRETEIAQIKELLQNPSVKILTLTGTGGTGKTSLARQICEDFKNDFPDGIYFVDLSAIEDQNFVVPTIAQTLGVAETGEKNLFDSLKNFLKTKKSLIILDNFEQIIEAKIQISELERSAENAKFLITSRVKLHLKSETEFQVPPLEFPFDEDSAEKIVQTASVKLFAQRASTAKPTFVLTDENARVIGKICQKLEGLPLALELAAPRVRLMPPSVMLERLENQLKFLTSAGRDIPPRQQTIRGSIAWSYELLEADEKLFFESLAVFVGGFSIESAEAVFDEITAEVSTLDLLDSLIDKNLLTVHELENGAMRFRFLEPVREFALEKASENGNLEEFKNRHAECFFELIENIEKERVKLGGLPKNQFEKLQFENDNLRAAISYLFETNIEKTLCLAANLQLFWSNNAQFTEGRQIIKRALNEASKTPSFYRGFACKGAGMLAWKQGDFDESSKFYDEALEIGEALPDEFITAIAKNGLGTIFYLQGEKKRAKRMFEEILPIVRKMQNSALITSILANLGEIARLEEDFSACRKYNEEIIEYGLEYEDSVLLCGSYINIAAAVFCLNDVETALLNYQKGMEYAKKLNLKPYISVCLDGFAAISIARKDFENGLRLAVEAKKIRAEIGYELELPDRIFREKYVDSLKQSFYKFF